MGGIVLAHLVGRAGPRHEWRGPIPPTKREPRWPAAPRTGDERGRWAGAKNPGPRARWLGGPGNFRIFPPRPGLVVFRTVGTFIQLGPGHPPWNDLWAELCSRTWWAGRAPATNGGAPSPPARPEELGGGKPRPWGKPATEDHGLTSPSRSRAEPHRPCPAGSCRREATKPL